MKHEDLNKNRTPAGFTRLSKLNKIKAKTKKKKKLKPFHFQVQSIPSILFCIK